MGVYVIEKQKKIKNKMLQTLILFSLIFCYDVTSVVFTAF